MRSCCEPGVVPNDGPDSSTEGDVVGMEAVSQDSCLGKESTLNCSTQPGPLAADEQADEQASETPAPPQTPHRQPLSAVRTLNFWHLAQTTKPDLLAAALDSKSGSTQQSCPWEHEWPRFTPRLLEAEASAAVVCIHHPEAPDTRIRLAGAGHGQGTFELLCAEIMHRFGLGPGTYEVACGSPDYRHFTRGLRRVSNTSELIIWAA